VAHLYCNVVLSVERSRYVSTNHIARDVSRCPDPRIGSRADVDRTHRLRRARVLASTFPVRRLAPSPRNAAHGGVAARSRLPRRAGLEAPHVAGNSLAAGSRSSCPHGGVAHGALAAASRTDRSRSRARPCARVRAARLMPPGRDPRHDHRRKLAVWQLVARPEQISAARVGRCGPGRCALSTSPAHLSPEVPQARKSRCP